MNDDVLKWKYFPRYWPFVRGIRRSPLHSPHKGQRRGTMMFSFICAWTNGWANNRDARDSRRHRAHYDVTVMGQSVGVHFECFNANPSRLGDAYMRPSPGSSLVQMMASNFKIQCDFNQNTTMLILENVFESVLYKWRPFCPGPSLSNGRAVWRGQSDIDIPADTINQIHNPIMHQCRIPQCTSAICPSINVSNGRGVWKGQRDTDISVDGIDHIHNPAMHQYHIPQGTILQQKCAQNEALCDICVIHCGISEHRLRFVACCCFWHSPVSLMSLMLSSLAPEQSYDCPCMIAPVPVNQPWIIWQTDLIDRIWSNDTTTT